MEAESQDGTRRFLGYIPVNKPPFGLYVSAGLSVKESFATIRSAIWRQFGVTGLAVLGTLFLASLTTRKFVTTRLEHLTSTVSQWRGNKLSARTGLTPFQGELGILGYQFDLAMDNIAKREESINVLLRELAHRSKNQIAVLISLCTQLARGQDTVSGYREAIVERLLSLSASQDLLVNSDNKVVDLKTLIEAQLKIFDAGNLARVSIDGPEVVLEADKARTLGMAIHEMATNATKYGALSDKHGSVIITWRAINNSRTWVELSWAEKGGPAVAIPQRQGFGRNLIEKIVPGQLNGIGHLHYHPEGVIWRVRFAATLDGAPPST